LKIQERLKMAYDELHPKRSRVVIKTPAASREVVETTAYAPERRGVSTGTVAIVAMTAVLLTALAAWVLTRPTTEQVTTTQQTVAQPTPITQVVTVPVPQQPQQPLVVPAAPATTTTQPVIVPVPATSTSSTTVPASAGSNDSALQSSIDKKLSDDPKIAALGITASVIDGKVTLIGSVDSREMKSRIERLVNIKGVKSVDNQIIVTGSAESPDATRD
jgi:hypothetical protein